MEGRKEEREGRMEGGMKEVGREGRKDEQIGEVERRLNKCLNGWIMRWTNRGMDG